MTRTLFLSGTEEERQIARDALWTTSDSQQLRGYALIALYFLRHYLVLAPDGALRNDVATAVAALEDVRESAKKLVKEQTHE